MGGVSISDLRNHGGAIVERASGGEHITITRSGRAIAELRPLHRAPLRAEVLIERRRRIPDINPQCLRADVDAVLDVNR